MKKHRWERVSLEECRRRVTADFEWEMGITEALRNDPDEEMLDRIAKARKALEPHIEGCTKFLFTQVNR